MESLNKKEIVKARWRFFFWFIPLLLFATMGFVFHELIVAKHMKELLKEQAKFETIFKQQALLSETTDSLANYMDMLRYNKMTASEYKRLNQLIGRKKSNIDVLKNSPDSLSLRTYLSMTKYFGASQSKLDSTRILEEDMLTERSILSECKENYVKTKRKNLKDEK